MRKAEPGLGRFTGFDSKEFTSQEKSSRGNSKRNGINNASHLDSSILLDIKRHFNRPSRCRMQGGRAISHNYFYLMAPRLNHCAKRDAPRTPCKTLRNMLLSPVIVWL